MTHSDFHTLDSYTSSEHGSLSVCPTTQYFTALQNSQQYLHVYTTSLFIHDTLEFSTLPYTLYCRPSHLPPLLAANTVTNKQLPHLIPLVSSRPPKRRGAAVRENEPRCALCRPVLACFLERGFRLR